MAIGLSPISARRTLVVTAIVTSSVGVVLTFAAVQLGGIGWDALFEANAMGIFASIGPDITLDQVRQLVPEQDVARGMWIYYLTLGLLGVTTGTSVLDPGNPGTYEALGFVTAAIVVLGSLLVAFAVFLMTHRKLAGVLVFALMFATPLWIGMASVAYRDAPIAVGLTLVSAGLALVLISAVDRIRMGVGFGLIALGTFLAIGSRAGAIALILVLVVLSIAPLFRYESRKAGSIPLRIGGVTVSVVVGLIGAIAVHPVARLSPIDWLVQSTILSQSNPTTMLVKVMAADVMSDDLPYWYIPAYVLAQLPLATIGAVLLAVIVLVTAFINFKKSPPNTRVSAEVVPFTITWPFIVQGVILPILIVVSGANMYDGLRHVLFVIPALLVLVTLSFSQLSVGRLRTTLSVVVTVAIVLGTFASVRWFPYSYAYVNPVAGAVKEPRIWELDYWGLSAREGVEQLQLLGATSIYVSPTANTSLPWGAREPDDSSLSPSKEIMGWYVFERWSESLPNQCSVDFEIKRDGHVLGKGGLCSSIEESHRD